MSAPERVLCPLCGGPNACAFATGSATHAGRCWCEDVSIAPDLLAAIPIDQVGRACVCASCIAGPAGTNAESA